MVCLGFSCLLFSGDLNFSLGSNTKIPEDFTFAFQFFLLLLKTCTQLKKSHLSVHLPSPGMISFSSFSDCPSSFSILSQIVTSPSTQFSCGRNLGLILDFLFFTWYIQPVTDTLKSLPKPFFHPASLLPLRCQALVLGAHFSSEFSGPFSAWPLYI